MSSSSSLLLALLTRSGAWTAVELGAAKGSEPNRCAPGLRVPLSIPVQLWPAMTTWTLKRDLEGINGAVWQSGLVIVITFPVDWIVLEEALLLSAP
ncbi:hypothetical protein AC579_4218 [Pseudocercospora musae]|uniref:Secreted protein n=1 Tax=Pseudocercospora musae TaxID=113226 RepID=A0A139ICZ6_9PEZI|nr:hypothetical protein AC579_4218 [Pseudocercospora musae]KXT12636.1 hypothetical protein AC579_4218 [Pseudocercospora musae]KXT12637.1 hypothetical protein AC579_4218 [Pseudocercospora musae]